MGHVQPLQNGSVVPEDALHEAAAAGLRSPLTSPAPMNPDPLSIRGDAWRVAEESTAEIIQRIQPTKVSEQRRRDVIDYVQRLIRGYLGSDVFPFGSVPLKTYLPDGDIDLTAVCNSGFEESLAIDVRSVLEAEEQNKDSEFEVKDVQYIHAEVKLVKCLIQNIVVDISFNQIGGLCTLCFLEKIDRLIVKDHLFKNSIILIKAWCYYESRILGAHHGLISTYALETLVLYVFHLFHSSLDGPLAVLYRFLDHFSKFDWDNYCISIDGPVRISSLPKLIAEVPETDGGELLLSKDFLNFCVGMFSVPPLKSLENSPKPFPLKNLNIVDPLKESNNLGRSVSKGNFYRIRSAFGYGARKLGRILLLPKEDIVSEVNKFFLNTLERHGSGHRPDVQDSEVCLENMLSSRPRSAESNAQVGELLISHHGGLCEDLKNTRLSDSENYETDDHMEGSVISGGRLNGDAKDLATRITKGVHRPASIEYFSDFSENGNHQDGNTPSICAPFRPGASDNMPEALNSNALQSFGDASNDSVAVSSSSTSQSEDHYSTDQSSTPNDPSNSFESNSTDFRELESNGLSDLTGDYENHFNSLQYVQWCLDPRWYQESAMAAQKLVVNPPSPSQNRNKHLWDANRQPLHLKRKVFHHMGSNGIISGPPLPTSSNYFSSAPPVHPGVFNMENLPKPRGTGTYFPNMNHHQYRDKLSMGRGRNHAPQTYGRPRNIARLQMPPTEASFPERAIHELAPPPPPPPPPPMLQVPIVPNGSGQGKAYPILSESTNQWPSLSSGRRLPPRVNGFAIPPEKLEFGSLGPVTLAMSKEPFRQMDVSDSQSQSSSGSMVPSTPRGQKLAQAANQERAAKMYQLKDDHDFPPLSV
ncbi:hypothetical protein QJS04_geneDACA005863 [Acorus gramineus]|uniref:Uncharacterized protein n=1 Tax=Acorus gramineus TaxID=55184 RepID=A0AAV9B655_ACOGR|nr:hypothetical protein QJS04_geneDACA005863 [Acorus gramineus]